MQKRTLDVEGDEPLVDQGGVGVIDPAAQQLAVVHGPGREGERAGKNRRVAVLHVVVAEHGVGQEVRVHPLDFRGHVRAVVWSVARQLQVLVTNNLLGDVDVWLICLDGNAKGISCMWIFDGREDSRTIMSELHCIITSIHLCKYRSAVYLLYSIYYFLLIHVCYFYYMYISIFSIFLSV